MKKVNILLITIVFILANPFDKWIDENKNIIKETVKTVSFQISVAGNFEGIENIIYSGNIVLGERKKFRFEMGPRTVVSDGNIWKSYDHRTDQVFIQKPDKKLEKVIFSWITVNKLKSLPIKSKSDGSYKINIFGKENDVQLYFNLNSNKLDSILIMQLGGMKTKISNIYLALTDSVPLGIGTEYSTYFDLR